MTNLISHEAADDTYHLAGFDHITASVSEPINVIAFTYLHVLEEHEVCAIRVNENADLVVRLFAFDLHNESETALPHRESVPEFILGFFQKTNLRHRNNIINFFYNFNFTIMQKNILNKMTTYELHNFIEDYPCQNDPDIQWNIASRKEFNEFISDKDKLEKVNRFFKHQQLFLRYIIQYDRILNIQATGTGKSGTVINAAEHFKKSGSNIKRVYILETGPATIQDFKNQIKKLSDADEYINDKVKYSMSKTSYNNNITRLLKEWYTIETYRGFAKKNYTDEMIIEEFSDCLFFFDEAHSLRNLKDEKGNSFSENEIDRVYSFLWRVTHLAKRSKFIVATATPMVVAIDDFVLLLNLLLPMNNQLPSPKRVGKDFYNMLTLNQLEPFFRGKITFIKFSETNINVINKGEIFDYDHILNVPAKNKSSIIIKPVDKKIENNNIITIREPRQESNEGKKIKIPSQSKLVNLEMQGVQLEKYLEVVKSSSKSKAFHSIELQTSIFVYPNRDYGTVGFEKYVYKDDLGEYQLREVFKDRRKKGEIKTEIVNGLYPAYISEDNLEKSLENLRLMSSKFHFYIKKELEASHNSKPGNSFCYIDYTKASGAVLLGIILRVFGFTEYKSNFIPRDQRTRKLVIEKKKRFLLLTGDNKNVQQSLDLFNSKENMHGEYVQIIIASERARVGINVKNVVRGYNMNPGWHESGMYQALSRFIRADSHDSLFEESGEKIDVDIYRLNATLPEGIRGRSVDTKLYLDAELKDIKNKRIMRFMKQCSFDAFLNYDRNVNLPPNTKNGDPSADYSDINYKIFSAAGPPGNTKRRGMAMNQGPNSGDYIYNTYNLLYSCNMISKVKNQIKLIIKNSKTILIDDLKKELNINFTDYIFNSALEELIFNREIISNKQNTLFYYLKYTSDLLFMKRESIYTDDKISTENSLYLDNFYPTIQKVTELKGEIKTKTLDDFYEEYGDLDLEKLKYYYIQEQDYLLFRTLLEDSLIRLRDGNLKEINKVVLQLLSNYILITEEPSGYIEAATEALKPERDAKQGRKRSKNSVVGLNSLDLSKVEEKKEKRKVYTHFYKDTGNDAYAINSLFRTSNKNIRILEENKNIFRDTDNAEDYVYNYLYKLKYDKIIGHFDKSRYYAFVIYRGGKGTIVEKEKEFFRIIDNSNKANRGRNCRSYDMADLISILRYLDTEGKYKKMLEGKIKKPILCPILEKLFQDKGLLFTSF